MFEIKDPAIKLFGKTIPLLESQFQTESGEKSNMECRIPADSEEMGVCRGSTKEVDEDSPLEELGKPDKSVTLYEVKKNNHQTLTQESKEIADPVPDEDQAETDGDGQEKALKKPDKILPCPRCKSMDTKFCYFNNYNVNQPRHFCKNCQRYWTAGGTMRNVPVGAGRRKNKHSASQYRHLMMSSDGIPSSQVDTSDASNHPVLSCGGFSTPSMQLMNGNGTVLKFGPNAPLCESIASVLNLGDQKKKVETGAVACVENGKEASCGSSMTASTCQKSELSENVAQMQQGSRPECCDGPTPAHQVHCYPGPPWAYPWNSGWNNVAAMAAGHCSSELVYAQDNSNHSPVQWGSPPMVAAAPTFSTPNIPFPFVPASYWGCMPGWAARAWNMPWLGSNGSLSPSSSTSNSGCSGNGSPILGKHSREANSQGEEKPEKCLWVPKTLRIDDPDEAAKSSIWATLGIVHDQNEPILKGGIFKAFQAKLEDQAHASDAGQVLQANPAALSRSQTFQESA